MYTSSWCMAGLLQISGGGRDGAHFNKWCLDNWLSILKKDKTRASSSIIHKIHLEVGVFLFNIYIKSFDANHINLVFHLNIQRTSFHVGREHFKYMYQNLLEWEVVTHSSIQTPWTEEPGRYNPWGCTELDMPEQLNTSKSI